MKSLAQKIALQFFLVLAVIVLGISSVLISIVGANIRRAKDAEINNALNTILHAVKNDTSLYAAESKLPYYITYTIYDEETQNITATNAPFIPILPESDKKPVVYLEKEFFTDGDLNLIYETAKVKKDKSTYVVQISNSLKEDEMFDLLKFVAPKVLAIIFIPLLFISYLAAFFIAKRTLRPIVKMTKAAANISSSNLDAMLFVSSQHDELDSLANTFNELFTRLKQDFISVNAANKAKSSFLSNMSHEIRTPINAVLGLDEMILRESTEPQIQTYARDIQSSGKSLLSIINDILDFSKIEAGKMEIIPVDYDLSLTIADLVNMTQTRAQKKGLDFIINIDHKMPHKLHGDEIRIKQCILNILTNAIKYTLTGSVTMSISCEKSLDPLDKDTVYLKVQVIDTGIGIKQEEIEKLFSPFERIEERRNRTIEGTGLGLSIVKSLLSQMGSHLEVQSEYGKGSNFSFTIEQQVLDWEEIGNYEEMKAKHEAEQAVYKESFQAPEANILAVDDTVLNLIVITGLLKNTRIQIDTCENGFDALKMAREKKYDIILIDHRMPKMDGLEMLHVLRGDSSSKSQYSTCIALTANAISGAKEMYLAAGFEDYLSKPIEASALEAMLLHHLPKNKVLHEGQKGYIKQENEHWNGVERRRPPTSSKETMAVLALWQELFDTNIASAIHHCGTSEVFMDALKNFYDSIEDKSALINQFAQEKDWTNYTVLVHALKSSARLIGADELSEKAAVLEGFGDKAKAGEEEAVQQINEKTGEVLELYKSYIKKLAPLLGKGFINEELPPLEESKFNEAMSALKEVVSVYDFDSADSIIAELEKYSIPAEFAEKYKSIKKAVQSVDQTAIMKLLDTDENR